MPLRVYNTLSQQKEPFATVRPGKVSMYVCGPTVYKPSHLGHMVGPVIFDAIKRYLTYSGYEVTFVVNITDVDDKLIIEAPKQNVTVSELAERITADYCKNLARLNVTGIDHMPRATHHIGDILEIIQGLIARDFAYPANGDVYFDVSRDKDYGKLCHRDPEQLEAGSRIEVSDRKRNPGDFALWKAAKPGEPFWDSPWGKGRPGWHIECSAMSMKILGKTLDMHGGGLDLQFPHHENELAQSESFTGVPFVKFWMHNGLMRIHSETSKIKGDKPGQPVKMSKSKGNEIVVTELFKRHEPETIRFFLLATHYRRPIDYSEERLEEIRRGLNGFYRFFERFERITGQNFYKLKPPTVRRPFEAGQSSAEFLVEVVRFWEQFLEHMDDDFNTGGAIGVLYQLLTALNRFVDTRKLETDTVSPDDVRAFERGGVAMKELSQILGVFLEPVGTITGSANLTVPAATLTAVGTVTPSKEQLVDGLMKLLIDLRADARKNKNFAQADQIRQRLAELGVTIEDRAGTSGWRLG